MSPRKNLGPCSVVAVDPGTTTGLIVVSIDPRWVRGLGPASWEGLGAAITYRQAYQIGRDPKGWDDDQGHSAKLSVTELDGKLLPYLAQNQPLLGDGPFDGRGRKDAHFYGILAGETAAVGRGDMLTIDGGEVLQVRQIAGLLDNHTEAALVIEDFSLRTANSDREVLSPARLRLAIQAEEILHGVGRVPFLQMPSEAMNAATNDRLKRAGLYWPGMPHATDAARHAALFFRRCRSSETVRVQAYPRHFQEWID